MLIYRFRYRYIVLHHQKNIEFLICCDIFDNIAIFSTDSDFDSSLRYVPGKKDYKCGELMVS